MLRICLRSALVIALFPTVAAFAGDVALPERKPKDAKGNVTVSQPSKTVTTTPDKAAQPRMIPGPLPAAERAILSTTKPSSTTPTSTPTTATPTTATPKIGTPPAAPKPPAEWTAEEVAIEKARCTAILKGVDAVVIPETPKREGACGAPAPVRLVSLGSSPQVALDPPALVTCDMVAMMAKWVKGDLQPLAKKHLGAELVKIETMSDYSCRAAYGRVGNKLSEHGKANALDIRGFVTAKGEDAMVLEGWGTTRREIAAAKAAEEKKAAAIKAAAEKSAAEQAEIATKAAAKGTAGNPAAAPVAASGGSGSSTTPRTTIVDGLPRGLLPKAPHSDLNKGLGLAPQQLGGPKEKDTAAAAKSGKASSDKTSSGKAAAGTTNAAVMPDSAPQPSGRISRFLHDAHASACRLFGTTLGPEANNAHKNHFHVDMAERRSLKICD